MARWGEEESKTKGIFGCLFAFVIIGIVGYAFYLNYDALEQRAALEKKVQDLARVQMSMDEGQLMKSIIDEARGMGVELTPDDIDLEISRDENYNFVVYYWIDIPFTLNTLFSEEEISLPITEKVTVISW